MMFLSRVCSYFMPEETMFSLGAPEERLEQIEESVFQETDKCITLIRKFLNDQKTGGYCKKLNEMEFDELKNSAQFNSLKDAIGQELSYLSRFESSEKLDTETVGVKKERLGKIVENLTTLEVLQILDGMEDKDPEVTPEPKNIVQQLFTSLFK